MNQDLQNTNFTCAIYTPRLPSHKSEILILGTQDGAVAAVNPYPKDVTQIGNLEWLEFGKKEYVLGEAISSIIYKHGQCVIAGA